MLKQANFERKLPVPEGRHKEKRRSFLPTPKSFTSAQDVGQDHTKAFSIQEKTKPHLQVGDKICIGGIKLGELQYFGKTHIAAGLWCGIELYEKEGKHDGEVEGVRYFTCRPGHGIFAPVDKVSKIELVPHDLHGDVIEEETEVPPEDVPEQKTVITRPQRRLLPQPQIFARKDPKEKIAVPTKIDEQNEDFDEVDFLGTSASQEPVVIPGKRSLPKIDPKIRTPSSKLFPELYNEQVCNLSSKDSKQSAIYTTSLSADALNENKNLNNCIPHENKLSSTYTLPQSSAEPGFAAFSKPSKLPAPSKLPQAPTPSVTEKNCTMSDNKQLTTETSVTENIGNNTFLSGNLNKTYNVGEIQIPVSTDIHMTTQSSGEDSISGEVQECLSSDHRHFLNLTFDMEGGGSPPQPTSSTQNPQKVFDDLQPSSSADATFDISHNSSLGVLDIHDSQLNSDLLQGETENVLAGEKKSLLNLTDLEKLSKVSILSRRQDRVASLGETFEAENAITSTPNVSGGRLKPSVLSFSVQAKESQSKDKNALGDEDVDFDIPLNFDLNATYEVSEEGRPVEMLGADTLDWRSEASDGDEPSASSEDSAENKQMNRTEDQDQLRAAAQKEINQRVDSLTEKISNLGITTVTGLSQSSLSAPKPKLPMVDSGISEQGDILMLEQGRMADSCEMRQSVTDEKQNLYKLMEEKEEIQLQADLIAGHLKKERPLSLVSSISADTGYVPDTDSERGTLTINSPLDWAEKMAQSSDSMAGVELTDLDAAYAQSFKNFQTAVLRGAGQVLEESDSDICSDGGTVLADNNDLGKEDSEFENMSTLLTDVKGISADDILPLSSEEKETEPLVIGVDVQQTASDTVIEDERIEADQQLDKLNVTMDIVRESSSEEKEAEDNEEKKEEPDEENEVTVKEVSEEESADEGSVTIEETKPQKKKKKKEAEKVEHKKPNIKVGSRIADYIKAPVPVKPKDENTEAAKNKRNMGPKGKAARLNDSKTKGGKEEGNEERKKKEKVEKEPPKIIKRTPPKSKWDSIMSQIEADKNVAKPKSEVKSKLESYLSTPPPPSSKKETAPKEKPKKKLPTVPTPDFSKVKSKLNLGAPVALIRRESSPAAGKKDSPRGGVSGEVMRRLSSVASNGSSKAPKLDLNDSASSSILGSAISSVRSSQSDLAGVDGGGESSVPSTPKTVQKPSNKTLGRISSLQERERRASTSSTMSTASQGSVKALNAKNSRISDIAAPRRKSVPAKGIVPVMSPSVRRTTQVSRSLDSSPANRPLTKTNLTGDRAKISSPQESRNTVKKDGKKSKGDNKPKSPPSTKKINNQNRNKTKTKNNQKPANQQSDVISLHNKQEVTRLEALCESRTKELNYARLQMKSNLQAFDAMTVMVQYLSQDLDAFSNPKLFSQVKTLQTQLEETKQQIEELQAQKAKLDESILQLNKDHLDQINALKVEHEKQISWEKEKHEENLTNYRQLAEEYHCKEIDHIKTTHDEMIAEMKADNSLIIQKLKKAQEVDIAALRNKHEEQMEELHKQHRDRLEEITHRFENIKMGLSEKVETLRGECDDLRTRARASEEALLRDSDVKVQMALSPYKNLPQEIESLKLVIEIRNEEIQKLKNRNIELEKQAEELRNAKEKIIAQQQKIENLEAIISMKTDHEKQLHDKCQLLMRKCDKESKANKRLSMDFEELIYKVNLSDPGSLENLSKIGGSPSHSANSSPAVRRKNRSPAFGDVDKSPASQVYRRSLSSVENSAEKKMKRRSANFLYEKDGTSPTGSPRHRVKTYSDSCSPTRGLHTHSESDRMVHSCEGVPTDKPRDNAARLIQSCNDAEVFEAPQGLPAPVTPDDIKGGMEEVNQSSKSTSAAKTELVSMNNGQSPDNLGQGGVDLEEFEGESLHIDTKEDTSDLSHSTESYCPSEVTSGTGSLIWDYEKMDSIKSMDSSQTSQTSDSMLDSSTLTDTKVDNNTLTNIKDLTTEESDTSSGFVETGEILVTTTSPSDSRKESTV